MGCWNETCAITRFPIHPNQPVFMFVIKKHYLTNLGNRGRGYGGLWPDHPDEVMQQVSWAGWGTYNDYGWIEELDRETFCSIYEKEYNPEDDRPDFRAIHIHKNVVEEIAKVYPPVKVVFSKENRLRYNLWQHDLDNNVQPFENHEYILSLIKFATECRINLTDAYSYKGAQDSPSDENWKLLLKMMRERKKAYNNWLDSI